MKRINLFLFVGVLAVMLIACGGGSSPPPQAVTLEAFEFKFRQTMFSAPAGAQVTLTFKNDSSGEHDFVMVSESTDSLTVTEADALGGIYTGTVKPGRETVLTFTAPAAGTYKYVCTIRGHAAIGMVGTFTSH